MSDFEPAGYNRKENQESNESVVRSCDLPLYCPTEENAALYSHPRVFIAIEDSEDKTARCPYCGTLYRLMD